MATPYTQLAALYDAVGMADYSRQMLSQMLDHAQRNEWLGREILELGCGTGEGIVPLADSGLGLTAIDNSPEMLEVAAAKSSGVNWVQQDIRQIGDDIGQQDLILAVDVLNELDDIRDIQTVFNTAHEKLKPGKPFIFDLHTIAGLTKRGTAGDEILHDSTDVTMFASNTYDYERQTSTSSYMTFAHDGEDMWNRLDATRVLRAFPLQAIVALLQRRVGFEKVSVMTTRFRPYDLRLDADRVVIAAWKKAE